MRPCQLEIIPYAAESLVRLAQAGFRCILVTNQSAVGRGMITVDVLREIHTELQRLLEAGGARFDAIYDCPVVPGTDDETVIEHPDRKPVPGILRRAAANCGSICGGHGWRAIDCRMCWLVSTPDAAAFAFEPVTNTRIQYRMSVVILCHWIPCAKHRIQAAWFQASGCIVCQAAASMLCEHIEHRTLAELADFRAAAMLDLIGIPLTPGRQPCGLLALQAFREILALDSPLPRQEQQIRRSP